MHWMPRLPSRTFTDKELDIMKVIWERGEVSAREIQANLPGNQHYNTVLTIIRVLERKGHLTHRTEGKSHIYRAVQRPAKSRGRVLGHLIEQFFGGSAASLVLHLVETGNLTESDLLKAREVLAARSRAARNARRGEKR